MWCISSIFVFFSVIRMNFSSARQSRADPCCCIRVETRHRVSLVLVPFATKCQINAICRYDFQQKHLLTWCFVFNRGDIYDQKRACTCLWKCNLVWQSEEVFFSVVYWKDLSTEALSKCFWLLKAKVNDNLSCKDIVQCVHVSSYLFTMMTLFRLSDAVLSFNILLDIVSFLAFLFCFVLFLHLIKLSMASAFMWY